MEKKHADASAQLQLLPGFRFHPTDEELLVHYLSRKVAARPFQIPVIAELDLYKFNPWDLPGKAHFGEKEWYFFSPRDRKYPNGARPNRAAASGYWKATGTDKPIYSSSAGTGHKVGVKKALVFYTGRAPKGLKTNWIMHEYRLTDSGGKPSFARKKGSSRLDDWVLCRIYNRSVGGSQKLNLPEKKEDVEEEIDESCLEDVLASLPDIDDANIFFPRIGPLQTYTQHDSSLFDRILEVEDLCQDGSKTSSTLRESILELSSKTLCTQNLASPQENNIHGMETKDFSILQDSRMSSAEPSQGLEMNFPEICDSGTRIDDKRSLKRARGMSMSVLFQAAMRPKDSFEGADDDVKSTCRSPMFLRRRDQTTEFHHQSAENCVSDSKPATERDDQTFFVSMNDLFPAPQFMH